MSCKGVEAEEGSAHLASPLGTGMPAAFLVNQLLWRKNLNEKISQNFPFPSMYACPLNHLSKATLHSTGLINRKQIWLIH